MNSAFRSSPLTRPSQQAAALRRHGSFDLAWLNAQGHPEWETRVLPVSDVIDAAISSLARGTLLSTPDGQIAVEDLNPGMLVNTAIGPPAQVQWIGSRCYAEGSDPSTEKRAPLYRVCAGAFGHNAPTHDLVLAHAAAVLLRTPACRKLIGQDMGFAPITAFEDSYNVTRILPAGEMTVYNIALRDHEAIIANGLPIESFHPCRNASHLLNQDGLRELARLFPHLSARNGFGPQRVAHLSLSETRSLGLF